MNIFVAIPYQFAGCGFYRQYQPHNRLAKTHNVDVLLGAGLKTSETEYMPDKEIKKFDILHMHKGYFDFEAIDKCRELGVKVVVDFDDWWRLDTEHIFYKNYQNDKTTETLIELLKKADYVTCTTDLLAGEITRYNQNVCVLPNAMDMNYDGCKIDRKQEKELIFGYLGGHCHVKDVNMLQGLNNKLSGDYKLRLMGYDESKPYQGYLSIMSDHGRKLSHFDWMPKLDIWNYPQFYNYLDVSLVPLVDNKFNSLKSELKLIEAGFFKKAVIVSNVQPYSPLLKHKVNAMVVNKPADWAKHAKYLIQNRSLVKELGEALYETVQPYDIDEVNKKRYKFYSDVLKISNTNSSDRHSRLQRVE